MLYCYAYSLPFFITTSGDVNSPKVWRSPWLNYRLSSTEEEGSVKRETKGPSGLASDWIITDPSKMSVRTPLWVGVYMCEFNVAPIFGLYNLSVIILLSVCVVLFKVWLA